MDDFDGHMLAAALEETPPSDVGSSEPERLDLTQIDFEPNIRARLLAAGTKAGVSVVLSRPATVTLRR